MRGQIQLIINVFQPNGTLNSGISQVQITDEVCALMATEDPIMDEALKVLTWTCLKDMQARA